MVKKENTPPPRQVLVGLRKWLEAAFGWKPASEGNILPRPHQTDTISCSICTLSTIAHNVFGDSLWEQPNASLHRILWLLKFNECGCLGDSAEPVRLYALYLGLYAHENIQENEPFQHTDIGPVSIEPLDIGGVTDGEDEPPASDLDGPALSTVSSLVSVGDEDEIEPTHHKRKRSPSIGLSDGIDTSRKLFRTNVGSRRQVRSEDAEAPHQDRPDTSTTKVDAKVTTNSVASVVKGRYKPGTSRSAQESRKRKEKVESGMYDPRPEKVEARRAKIRGMDPEVKFDENDHYRIFHKRCGRWIRAKEVGDTTRFKEHLRVCPVKPVPTGGTLMGMGWLKKIEKNGERMESREHKPMMPCRGVSGLDNPLVDQYLTRTGAGGGGARSIHLISRERFSAEYKNLTKGQKDEVHAVQRAEWTWRNDYNDVRVFATKCKGFTSSRSFDSSVCHECKSLLNLKAFTVAIHKKIPLDENAKFVNTKYVSPVLLDLYGRVKGFRNFIDQNVSITFCYCLHC